MKILFGGCSTVQGAGLAGLQKDPDNFTNIVGTVLGGHVTNVALPGNSNERIFVETAEEMCKNRYDLIFVGWTSFPRHVFWPGLELYECRRTLSPAGRERDYPIKEHNGNDISWTSKKFRQIQEWFMMLTHDHYFVVDLCRYISILKNLANNQISQIYFLNNAAPWDPGYFEQFDKFKDSAVRPDMLTSYTNALLNSKNRDDDQINALFHKMGNDYQQAGNIQAPDWLNLYQPFVRSTVDLGNDGLHPGPLSHRRYAEFLLEKINQHTKKHR